MYKIAIDAHNITVGGGLTHLINVLSYISSLDDQYELHLFATEETLIKIPDHESITKFSFNRPNTYLNRFLWQILDLPKFNLRYSYQLLFVPGSLYVGFGIPYVVLIQNLLPFSPKHILQYGFSSTAFRLATLFFLQYITVLRSLGVIYLSKYSQSVLSGLPLLSSKKSVVIYHGVTQSFSNQSPPVHRTYHDFLISPARIVYISPIEYYKNHDLIVRSLAFLKDSDIPFHVYFVGSSHANCLCSLKRLINKLGLVDYISFVPPLDHSDLPNYLSQFDLALWSSSCETFGISLLEYLAVGLPVVALDNPTTREIASNTICSYHKFSPVQLYSAINSSLRSPSVRIKSSYLQRQLSVKYSWAKTSDQTFRFFKSLISPP